MTTLSSNKKSETAGIRIYFLTFRPPNCIIRLSVICCVPFLTKKQIIDKRYKISDIISGDSMINYFTNPETIAEATDDSAP